MERPAAAAAAGFDAVEMWWPFADLVPAPADVDRFVGAFGEAGVALISINLASGSVAAGQHGLVALHDERTRFGDHLEAAIAIAGRLGGRVLNALDGNPPEGISRGLLDDTAVENLAFAARGPVVEHRPVGADPHRAASRSSFPPDRVRSEDGPPCRLRAASRRPPSSATQPCNWP
jgi:hydroxypyruvate isomerase